MFVDRCPSSDKSSSSDKICCSVGWMFWKIARTDRMISPNSSSLVVCNRSNNSVLFTSHNFWWVRTIQNGVSFHVYKSYQLLFCSWSGKSIRLARPSLPVGNNANIVTVEEEREEWCKGKIKNSALICEILEDVIKMEPLVGNVPVSSRESQVAEVVWYWATRRRG